MDGNGEQEKRAPQPGMTSKYPETPAEFEASLKKGAKESVRRGVRRPRGPGRSET